MNDRLTSKRANFKWNQSKLAHTPVRDKKKTVEVRLFLSNPVSPFFCRCKSHRLFETAVIDCNCSPLFQKSENYASHHHRQKIFGLGPAATGFIMIIVNAIQFMKIY